MAENILRHMRCSMKQRSKLWTRPKKKARTAGARSLVAEPPPDSKSATELHLVSVFGGDQEIGATLAAAHEGLRFQVRIGGSEFIGTLGEKPVVYRSSLQIPGRKRPVRHAVILSKALFETTFGAKC